LKDLADRQGLAWHYAPLHRFLNHPEEAVIAPREEMGN
jgi:hypothetical protein